MKGGEREGATSLFTSLLRVTKDRDLCRILSNVIGGKNNSNNNIRWYDWVVAHHNACLHAK